jgi:uncharacterized iron-regulated protein
MIDDAAARAITPELLKDEAALGAALGWQDNGWPDFSMYYPIFTAAPGSAIYGGALPREKIRNAMTVGAAAVFGDAATAFGLDEPLPTDQLETRVTLQRDAHCNALPEDLLPGIVEAQRLRDAALARATVAAFAHARASSDTPRVVVIAGNGHVREDWGVPAMLRSYFGEDAPEIATLGQFEDTVDDGSAFTEVDVAAPPEREDPCLAFAR